MLELGDLVRAANNHAIHGIIVEHKRPHKDWRFESRLPNSGVCVMWNTGDTFWCCYRELEKIN